MKKFAASIAKSKGSKPPWGYTRSAAGCRAFLAEHAPRRDTPYNTEQFTGNARTRVSQEREPRSCSTGWSDTPTRSGQSATGQPRKAGPAKSPGSTETRPRSNGDPTPGCLHRHTPSDIAWKQGTRVPTPRPLRRPDRVVGSVRCGVHRLSSTWTAEPRTGGHQRSTLEPIRDRPRSMTMVRTDERRSRGQRTPPTLWCLNGRASGTLADPGRSQCAIDQVMVEKVRSVNTLPAMFQHSARPSGHTSRTHSNPGGTGRIRPALQDCSDRPQPSTEVPTTVADNRALA